MKVKGGSLGACEASLGRDAHQEVSSITLDLDGNSNDNLFTDEETETQRRIRQSQDSKVSSQTSVAEPVRGSLSLPPLLPEFHNQVRMDLLQGTVELVFAGPVPGPAEAKELAHLAWLGGLSPYLLILFFTQDLSMQLVQERVH